MTKVLKCPECEGKLRLKESVHGLFYGCERYPACTATHGCHQDGERKGKPLGTPADKLTKQWRIQAHEAFDKLWKVGDRTRFNSYKWLAKQLGIKPRKCHIAMMNIEQCKKVIEICGKEDKRNARQKRREA